MAPDDQPHLDPELADAVRDAYVRPVDGATARQHLSAIVAAADAAQAPVPVRRRRRWRAVVATAAATLALPAGLAVAGLPLPHVVERPYRAVGIDLPHQTRDAGPAATPRPTAPPAASASPTPTSTASASPTPARPAEQRTRREGQLPRGKRNRHGNPRRPARPAQNHRTGPPPSNARRKRPTAPKSSAGPKPARGGKGKGR